MTRRLPRLPRTPLTVLLSAVFLAVAVLCALAGPLLAPHALDQDLYLGTVGAGVEGHLSGTDALGRDVLSLAVLGTRSALLGPVLVACGSMLLGLLLGTLAGFRGGWLDTVVGRYADLLLALPAVLLAMVVVGMLGGGYWVTVLVLVVLFSPTDVRLVRAAVMEQAARPYIESARVLGIRPGRIMVRHVLPNTVPIVVANLLLNTAFAMVALSSLSYLGLGVAPGAADWGRQLADGQRIMVDNPLAAILPGVLIILAATSVNLLGDWLAERLDRKVATR
ncbi:ABC transporter permease [Kitasatospora sp. NPDC004272]